MQIRKKFCLTTNYCLLAAIVLLLSGCATTDSSDSKLSSAGSLKPQSILKFSDVPVPAGLKPLPLESYSFESSGVRVGVLKYIGKANPDQVVNFYKDQMPMYNWSLVNIVEYSQRLLNFEREGESCIISMQPKGSSIILTISLGPKSQAAAKRTKQIIR
ncbi:MAG: hypothetical protein JXL82_00085 [Candidatus Omnitrophica bacterium]|nr:hypothetical protein [Candidatus Omnitrophota bacterium]